jgi:hypothetical protein
MLQNKQMDFTLGNKTCIPYVKDFAVILNKISTMPIESGIYNIFPNKARTIKSLIEDIRNILTIYLKFWSITI